MPTRGLSLVGFMRDPAQAINHLKISCVPTPVGKSDAAFLADWTAAQAQLGAPVVNAGRPQSQLIPLTDPHVQAVLNVPWAAALHAMLAQGATFQMVEIDPLLAFQFTIDEERAATHCVALSQPPTRDELMALGLPLTLSNDQIHASQQGQSVILKSRSLNLIINSQGPMPNIPNVIGIQFAWALPIVHVVKYNDKYILHNGYHRAFGARLAGAPMIPAIIREVTDPSTAGIQPDGATFDEVLLMSANPPTLSHFTQGHALHVELRRAIRLLQVNWSQHVMYDE
jgi:hypothetical protein